MRERYAEPVNRTSDGLAMTTKPFNDIYKEWRNRARRYSLESIVNGALEGLCESKPDLMTDIGGAPWLTMLMVKWACQDRHPRGAHLPPISPEQLHHLRNKLWDFQKFMDTLDRNARPQDLGIRRMMRPQLGFQRGLSNGFVREAALLAEQVEDHPLRKRFKQKTGFDVIHFVDLSWAVCYAILGGKRVLNDGFLSPLHGTYTPEVVSAFESSVSRTLDELTAFCRALPHTKKKVSSEYFEFPVLTRYPFFRTDDAMVCWHPAVLYRGLESFVHSVLSEAREEREGYMRLFSQLFEQHVVAQARKVPGEFLEEGELRQLIAAGKRVPDGLLSFPGCNVYVESKAGLFLESVMTLGSDELFRDKTKAIAKAVEQAWATSVSLREERRAPPEVLRAGTDYLLIVTNKELGLSKGTALAATYPDGTLDYPNIETERLLPHNHIYVLSIDDFERLTNAAAGGQIELPEFLASCVRDDQEPKTAVRLFEQHLNRGKIPVQFSDTVENACQASHGRLERALGG